MNVAVAGAGSIGVGWSVVFAAAGADVRIYDPDPGRLNGVRGDLEARLERLAEGNLLGEPVAEVARRVKTVSTLADAVVGAEHVQECAPEELPLKRELFSRLAEESEPTTVLASSASFLTASAIAADLSERHRCLVAHPGNPPYLLRVVELVPAPFTSGGVVARAKDFFQSCGIAPVLIAREVEGFAFNRLQGALLREAYCLVRDGVISPDDVDRLVRDGLGRRWSVVGPFETVELNTRGGIERHAQLMGPAYERMGAERGQRNAWTPGLVAEVAAALHARIPPERWEERVAWRDAALIELERARRQSALFTDPF